MQLIVNKIADDWIRTGVGSNRSTNCHTHTSQVLSVTADALQLRAVVIPQLAVGSQPRRVQLDAVDVVGYVALSWMENIGKRHHLQGEIFLKWTIPVLFFLYFRLFNTFDRIQICSI